jgi:2-polyprenyl-6-hydroxyphenyl methylase/3-demethylubiquinone-9 3-methyltransferase
VTIGYTSEIKGGQRFKFGKNWETLLPDLDENRIRIAQESVELMLGISTLQGKSFLDVGCGSGVFSLAAARLGAKAVHSFDYDPHSVECTHTLRRQLGSSFTNWTIEQGSALDVAYLGALGQFDVVYSWGVLHHTGNMWLALQNVASVVAPGGCLFIAIYNRQKFLSKYWTFVKRLYNQLPRAGQITMEIGFLLFYGASLGIADMACGRSPMARWAGQRRRGMTMYVDIKDWIGGYPFEVASPEEIFRFYRDRGFTLKELKTCGGKHGCNEFIFVRTAESANS